MPFCLRTAISPRRSALAVLLNFVRFSPTRSPSDLPLTRRGSSLGEKLSSKPLTRGSHHRGSLQDRLPAFQKPPLPKPDSPAGRNHHPPGAYGLRNSSPISPAHPLFTPLCPATLSSSQAAGGRGLPSFTASTSPAPSVLSLQAAVDLVRSGSEMVSNSFISRKGPRRASAGHQGGSGRYPSPGRGIHGVSGSNCSPWRP